MTKPTKKPPKVNPVAKAKEDLVTVVTDIDRDTKTITWTAMSVADASAFTAVNPLLIETLLCGACGNPKSVGIPCGVCGN